ncbi:MAG: TonB-dependent receptor [Dechloromonas sp.]|nr:TonB-dependent receptor [Dechloromonas sp.]
MTSLFDEMPRSHLTAVAAALMVFPFSASPLRAEEATLPAITVSASADASAGGLMQPYAGGQVARGGRAGILGNKEIMDTPFSSNAYTSELIQDQQAKSVGDVLLNDPSVRVARGFGNFQESYFIRGFILNSDSVAYNGLYGLLPRQYIAAELFERVEVLRGASAFLNGASPNGDGIGGTISLLPKRAPNEALNRVTAGWSSGNQSLLAADVARRFGPNGSTGVRMNVSRREGGTGIDNEHIETSLFSLGLDWRSEKARLSADIAYQDNKLRETRTNVTLNSALKSVPSAPRSNSNWAQPWTYSNERDVFGTLRGEYDFTENITGWFAGGMRQSAEGNSLANLTVTNATTGAGTVYRFDNTREDSVRTGEAGLRGKLATGPVSHEWVATASYFDFEKKNAYAMDSTHTRATNLYNPVAWSAPDISLAAFKGNALSSPALNGTTKLTSQAVGDTLSILDKRLQLTLGVRHQTLEVVSMAYNTGAVTSAYDKSRTSPVAGLVVKPLKEVSLYANYIEGLAQGGTAPSTAANRGEMLAPYVSKQKEAGVKVDLGTLGLTTAYFTTEMPRGVTNAANIYGAEGSDERQGIELMAYGMPLKGLRVLGGATFLDATQRNTNNAATEGKRTIGVPSKQANFGIEWSIPGLNGLSVDARVIATGAVYANASNSLKVPGWTRVDLGARYVLDLGGRLVTLRGRVDNVTDRDYWASSGGYPDNGYLVLGAPRTFTLSASVDL